jgi:predicted ABC-type ATPase
MFAGPNGSGKSSLKGILPPEYLGVYLNADDIEAALRREQRLDGRALKVQFSEDGLRSFFRDSALLARIGESGLGEKLHVADGSLSMPAELANSYVASVLVDYVRQELLRTRKSFTMETVMSHRSKVELLRYAQSAGYRTYLYYVATDDPKINVSRVKLRVGQGGHPVPEEKTIKRYHASLALLQEAIACTNRAYIFDNSAENSAHTWIAEVTGGAEVEIKVGTVPGWFQRSVRDRRQA